MDRSNKFVRAWEHVSDHDLQKLGTPEAFKLLTVFDSTCAWPSEIYEYYPEHRPLMRKVLKQLGVSP